MLYSIFSAIMMLEKICRPFEKGEPPLATTTWYEAFLMRIMSMHLKNSPNDGWKKLHLTNLYLSFRLPRLCTLQMQYLAFLLSTKDGDSICIANFLAQQARWTWREKSFLDSHILYPIKNNSFQLMFNGALLLHQMRFFFLKGGRLLPIV